MLIEKEVIRPGRKPHRSWTLNRKATCHPDRKHYSKGLCKHCYRNTPEWKDKIRQYARKPEVVEKRKARRRQNIADGEWLKVRYGLSVEDYNQMLILQNGACAICKKKSSGREKDKNRPLNVDHDHETGKIRGLLCHKCNIGIGHFNDDPELMTAAVKYIQQHKETKP